jgi:hypothetical protein
MEHLPGYTMRALDEYSVAVLKDGIRFGVYGSIEQARRIIANAERLDLAAFKRHWRKTHKRTSSRKD